MAKTTYITTPIYYINDVPHIGHAYTTIAGDILARYKRLVGKKVYYLTGTDEHGQKVADAAEKKGLAPQKFVDSLVPHFKKAWEKLLITNDDFIRTTEPRHTKVVQGIFSKLLKQGDVYKGEYEGWYCSVCETFWTETQLVDGKCPNEECKRPVQKLKEESYFFKLSKYEKPLLDHIENNPDFIQPESRKNEIVSFIKQGLKDLSISRTTFKWGIPIKENKKHVVYVWFDALINYLSALGYNPEDNSFEKPYWPADVHIMGKEITRFHAVIWPAMLMGLGVELPKVVFGHGWWTVEGKKMSKTTGNVIDPIKLSEEFGVDVVRYFLLREVPFGSDGDFSRNSLIHRFNSDLANDIGNLLNRSLAMTNKYFDGVIPPLEDPSKLDTEVIELGRHLPAKVKKAMEHLKFSLMLDDIWEVVKRANKYVEESAPWTLSKEGKLKQLGNVMHVLISILRISAIYISPFMPTTAEKMWEQMGLGKMEKIKDLTIDGIKPGTKVQKGQPLFPRIEIKK
ncbi:methionine--tRNA ligase [Candidatus Margulisiibacteriota bacterium]